MTLPPNVLRTREIDWRERKSPAPFGGRIQLFSKHLPLSELGFHLDEIAPGKRLFPLHDHLFEEELFYLLSGRVTVYERTADGARRQFELHAGELISYPGGTRIAHALANPGSEPACVLAMSDQRPGDICTYPDSGKTNFRHGGLGVGAWLERAEGAAAAERVAAAAAVVSAAGDRRTREPVQILGTGQRPSHVAAAGLSETALEREFLGARGVVLSAAAGARALSLTRCQIAPGTAPGPLLRHHHNEQALWMLGGRLTLRQRDGEAESSCELEAGDVVHWPANASARQLRNEGAEAATFLLFGTARPWNLIEFPERGDFYSAALDQCGHLERLEYFIGEAPSSS